MPFHRIGKGGSKVYGRRGAGIFFTDGKQVLMLKRAEKGDNSGTWGIPGGKQNKGETDIGTAMREAREECGQMEGKRFDDMKEHNGHHTWRTFFFRIGTPFDCTLSDEHSDWKWVPIDDLEKLKLHPAFEQNLNRYRSVMANRFKHDLNFKEWLF